MSTEQQPHLEILSHNRVNRSTIIIGVIPVTAITVVFVAAVWPFLSWIAYGSLSLLGLAALYLVTRGFLDVRRRWLQDAIVHASEHGLFNVASWEHLPALPAPSVQVSEVKDDPVDRVKQALDILEMHSEGSGYRSIAKAYKEAGDEYWTEYRVREILGRAKPA